MLAVIVLSFAAAGAQPAVPAAAAKPAANSPDKVVCRSFVETGSLVASHKVCKTRRDWDREHDELRNSRGPDVDSCRNRATGGAC